MAIFFSIEFFNRNENDVLTSITSILWDIVCGNVIISIKDDEKLK